MWGGKGFFLLKAALDKLWKDRQNFCLDVHFEPAESSPYIIPHDRYNYDELEQIFDETDVLVAPSIWYETFGYTILVALSYGVPVIVSDNVGAKDILADGAGIVIANINSNTIKDCIANLSSTSLSAMNCNILKKQAILTIDKMAEDIMNKCYLEA